MQADIGRLADATETGVIVPVAAAERAAGRFRRASDHHARLVAGSDARWRTVAEFTLPG